MTDTLDPSPSGSLSIKCVAANSPLVVSVKKMFYKTRLYLRRFVNNSRSNWYKDLRTKHKWMLSNKQLTPGRHQPPLPSLMWPTQGSFMSHKWVVRAPTWDLTLEQTLFMFRCCCCSVSKSCPTLCNPVGCSTPGFSNALDVLLLFC